MTPAARPRIPAPRAAAVVVRPATPARWPDLERLFGARGACATCWCMWFKLTRAEFDAGRGGGNRAALRGVVTSGAVPGLLAYDGATPVGWVAVERREAYPRLDRSRTLARVDDRPVWSITCFFVARSHRGRGVTRALVQGALRHVRARGGRLVEAYPVDPKHRVPSDAMYHGAASTLVRLGFREVARRSPTRPIVRKALRR